MRLGLIGPKVMSLLLGLSLLLTLGLTHPVAAQVAYPGIASSSRSAAVPAAEDSSALAEAIRQAAEQGVGVIVVDNSGRPLAPGQAQDNAEAQDAKDEASSASAMMQMQSEMDAFRKALNSRLQALPYSLKEVEYILRATSPTGEIMTYVRVLGWTLLFLLIARWLTSELYGKRLIRSYVVARIQDRPDGYAQKMPFLVLRFFAGMGGTVFAMVLAFGATMIIFGPSNDTSIEFTGLAIYTTYFLACTASDLWRMVLSPYLSQYRIPVFSDQAAKRLYIWASVLAVYDIAAVLFSTWIGDFGLNQNVYALVYGILMLVSVFGNVLCVLVNWRAISTAIRGGVALKHCSWLVRACALAWGPAVVIYLVFGWLALAFDLVLGRETGLPPTGGLYMVMMSVLVVYGIINYGIESYFDRRKRNRPALTVPEAEGTAGADESQEEESAAALAFRRPRHPIATYKDLAQRTAGLLAFVVGVVAMVYVWDSEIEIRANSLGDRALDVITVLFIGYVVYHMARIWIDSKIEAEGQDEDEGELGDEGGGTSASRLATLLPLFRGAILAVVVVSIALIVLMEMGINVSPLFAGAGVVGLAVGFGSQTLVRDIFSGAFFLLDDAFRRGEYIDIGSVKGTVEKISVRSFQLRHHLGALHTIPFGEIQVLTNYSRDWVIMKLPLRVTYDTDVEKVRKMIKTLGQELLKDPVIGENFIQPLKSQGVIEMQDSAMIIRVKFMTKPGDQWLVRKKVFQEIRELFHREGIKFAHREVTVRVVDPASDGMSAERREAALGAAHAAIEDELMDENDGGDDR